MPGNIVGTVIFALMIGIWLLAMVRVLIKAMKNKYAPIKTVKAVVIDKHITETFSKYSGNGKNEK